MKPNISRVISLAKIINNYNTIARQYNLSVTAPKSINWYMDIEEYNQHINILKKILKHPYLKSTFNINHLEN